MTSSSHVRRAGRVAAHRQPAWTKPRNVVATATTSELTVEGAMAAIAAAEIEAAGECEVYVGGTASGSSTGARAESGSTDGATLEATVTAGQHTSSGHGPGGGRQR